MAAAELVADALRAPPSVKRWQGFYLCPTFTQAKAVAWPYIKEFTSAIPRVQFNESELKVTFPNGASIQLLGASEYDALRGRYADSIVLDETAQIPTSAWTTVLSPMLMDRRGRAVFIGTPQGRKNLFYKMYQYATLEHDPEWRGTLLKWSDTNVLDELEVRRLKRSLSAAEFAQELDCSWDAALQGAYYAKELEAAGQAGRITTVPYDSGYRVQVAVDLGWSDGLACTFWQQVGSQHRCIFAKEYHMTTIPEVVADWRSLPFPIDRAILPHDARVHELGTGQTRQETFHSLGVNTTIAASMSVHEGIEQLRRVLQTCLFDHEGTRTFTEALRSYRSRYDEVKGVHSVKPLHDWSSHLADSGRYYAIGHVENYMEAPQMRGQFGTI